MKTYTLLILIGLVVAMQSTVMFYADAQTHDAGVTEAPQPADTATEPTATPSEADEMKETATQLWSALTSNAWALAALLTMLLIVQVIRWAAAKFKKVTFLQWFTTKWGGWILSALAALAGGLITAYTADKNLSWAMLGGVVLMVASTSGVNEFLKDLPILNTFFSHKEQA